MHSDVQPFINEDIQQTFIKQYQMLRHKLLTLLNTPVKTTHHIGGTSHFNYPTEPILDVLVGVNDLHDITALDEKRLNYEGFYRLHHPYHKKVVMAQFNNLIDLKQIARLH
ncbi:GrpB family protein, partial [Staphylococcus cohnii]|uniref:GrpB family protein n=2 Tax=Staphylococcus TaxID=1279 RepID=UPI000D467D50